MTKYLLILLLTAPAWAEVIIIQCDNNCEKMISQMKKTETKPDSGLTFGEPVCEPENSEKRRCGWSHSFQKEDTTEKKSDITWLFQSILPLAIELNYVSKDDNEEIQKQKLSNFWKVLDKLPEDWKRE